MADWHPEDIKAAVRRRGVTLVDIGAIKGISRQSIALTLAHPFKKGEEAIAEFLGIPASKIWPSRYHANGKRRVPQPPENYIRKARFGKPATRRSKPIGKLA